MFLAPNRCPVPGARMQLSRQRSALPSGPCPSHHQADWRVRGHIPGLPASQALQPKPRGHELHPLCEDQLESSIPGRLSQGSPGTPVPVTSDDSHPHKLSARWTELSSKVNLMGGEEVLQPERWAEASTCWGRGWGVVAGGNSHSFCPPSLDTWLIIQLAYSLAQ